MIYRIGLDQKNDGELAKKFSKGRIYLANEQCDFYCLKHQYPLIDETKKHQTKKIGKGFAKMQK